MSDEIKLYDLYKPNGKRVSVNENSVPYAISKLGWMTEEDWKKAQKKSDSKAEKDK